MNPSRLLRTLAVAGVAAALAGAGLTAMRRSDPPTAAPSPSPRPSPSRSVAPSVTPSPSPTPSPSRVARPAAQPAGLMPTVETIAASSCGDEKARKVVRWRVEVDRAAGIAPATFAAQTASVICDARSWIASETVRFVYDPRGTLLIGLRVPAEAERRCYRLIRLSVNRTWSCGTPREVVINADRWTGGSRFWAGPLAEYRRMLMNHEVGHALLLHHEQCPADGEPAPVMMQQSKGMRSPNGRTCRPNPWPLPREIDLLR